MTKWEIILLAAGTSYLIRALPILVFSKLPLASDGLTYKFLNYAALSVMGGIIYTALFGSAAHSSLSQLLQPQNLLKLTTTLLALLLTVWKRKVFLTLLCCLAFYYLLSRLIDQ